MRPFVLALAGGTGSGKSTLAEGINAAYEGETLTIHLDDYFKRPPELPKLGEYLNWDHPEAVNSQQLHEDLEKLKRGQSSEITQKDPNGIREYDVWEPRKRERVEPKRLIILEGFLALHYPELRILYDYSVYLDAPFETHLGRRVHNMRKGYKEDVLQGMHTLFMEPSKEHADEVIDAAKNDKEAVLRHVLSVINLRLN